MAKDIWSLVLAAGAGRRLRSITGETPKQFWRPNGGRSLLEGTVDRLMSIASVDRTVTVVDRSHRPFIEARKGQARSGDVVYQPTDRGTAAGVLLGLNAILEKSLDPIIVITPSDHGIDDVSLFRMGIERATRFVRTDVTDVILFGVEPNQPHSDYGWITPASGKCDVLTVGGFVEKPSAVRAKQLWACGAVWSTMVVVARARALATLYERHLPKLYEAFSAALNCRAANGEVSQLDYEQLPHHDFSRDLLAPATGLSLIIWPASIGWSDLGTPERLMAWQRQNSDAGLGARNARGLPVSSSDATHAIAGIPIGVC